MKITIKELLGIHQALNALNGKQVIVKQDDTKESVVTQPYNFGPKAIWNIAKNISVVANHVKTYTEVRDSIIKKLTKGEREIPPTDKFLINKFFEEMEVVESQELEINNILKIRLSDLNVDENKIPPSILAALMPIIEE